MSFGVGNIGTVLQACMALVGSMVGPILALFSLGIFYPYATAPVSLDLFRTQLHRLPQRDRSSDSCSEWPSVCFYRSVRWLFLDQKSLCPLRSTTVRPMSELMPSIFMVVYQIHRMSTSMTIQSKLQIVMLIINLGPTYAEAWPRCFTYHT